MSESLNLRAFSEMDLKGAKIVPARPVNLRRDLYQFVAYVQSNGLTRTYRENSIPIGLCSRPSTKRCGRLQRRA